MKKLFLLLVYSLIWVHVSQAQTFTSVQSGSWSEAATWDLGSAPGSSSDVVISNGDSVVINTASTIASLIINGSDESNYGVLTINTNAELSTTSHTTIYGKVYLLDGVFNEGNSSGDKLIVNGSSLGNSCLMSISGGVLNISRYLSLSNASSMTISGGILNINSSGGSTSADIINIPAGTTFTMTDGIVNILNGNAGSGATLKYNPSNSIVTGGTINLLNIKNYSATTLIIDDSLYEIVCDVGSGDTLLIRNMPSTSDGVSFHDFTITSGVVVIEQGSGLTITNSLTNNSGSDGFVIESTSSGNGSLISSGSIIGTVQRYIEAYSGDSDGWHEISSPVNNMTIDGSDFDPGVNDDLFAWSESSNTWLNQKTAANNITNFINGQGYLVAYESTSTKDFTGTLNTSDVTFSNLSNGVGSGWHLLGNPFSSAVNWNNGDWALSNVGGVAKVWNEAAGNYTDIPALGVIPSTNGFFIQVSDLSNTITIPASSRVHNSLNNFKSVNDTSSETLIVRVASDYDSYSDQCVIGFKENATEEWDIEFDSRKLWGSDNAPQIWTISMGEELSTNYLPHIVESFILPLSFKAGSDGNYKLSFDNINSFFDNSIIELEDIFTGAFIDLTTQPNYDFEASVSDDPNRFLLHFFGVTHQDEILQSSHIIYSYNNEIYISNKSNKSIEGNIMVYNMLGQNVVNKEIVGERACPTGIYLSPGSYIIRFLSDDGITVTKLFIN